MNKDQKAEKFDGFYMPNSTPVPDNFFDELLADLSGAEVKVVCYVMRRTFGFKRQSDNISISQMLNGIVKKDGTRLDRGTGLSKPTLLRALRTLKERRVLIANRNSSTERGDEATNYHLNIREGDGGKILTHGGVAQSFTTGVVKNFNPPVVKKINPQDTVIQDTDYNNNVNVAFKKFEKTDLRKLPNFEQDKEKIKYLAIEISKQLGDRHSQAFYYLVSAKVPEYIIRQTLTEIKQSEPRSPAAVFTSRMKSYATEAINKQHINNLYSSTNLAEKMKFH